MSAHRGRHCPAAPGRCPGRRRRGPCREIYAARRTVALLADATAPVASHDVDELIYHDYFRLTRAGKVTVINKRKLDRDHLELSTLFRGWLCSFCNVNKIPLLDARTTAEYKLYQGRLYVNCTTFPSP